MEVQSNENTFRKLSDEEVKNLCNNYYGGNTPPPAVPQMNAYNIMNIGCSNFKNILDEYNNVLPQIELLKSIVEYCNSISSGEDPTKEFTISSKEISILKSLIDKLDNEREHLLSLRLYC